MTKPASNRIHSMDAVRAIAMLLGIVLHACVAYRYTTLSPWPVDDSVHSFFYNYLFLFIHSFRMQLFFLIAGFFARLLYLKIGRRDFIKHRLNRIVRPFFICLIVIAPISMLPFFYYQYSVVHPGLPFVQDLMAVFPNMFRWNGMVHLWFLYYLIIFYSIMLFMQFLYSYSKSAVFLPPIFRKIPRFSRLISLLMVVIAVFFMTCLLKKIPIDPYTGFTPDWSLWAYYGFFFCLGYLIHRYYINNLEVFKKNALIYFFIGIIITPVVSHLDLLQATNESYPLYISLRALFSIQTVLLSFGFLGIFIKYMNSESYAIRYISDASYCMYLVHVPIIVWLQIWLIGSPIPGIFRFWIVVLAGILIPLAIYALFVRYSFIGKALNGPRLRRRKETKYERTFHAIGTPEVGELGAEKNTVA